jgi:hypothetical protein
MRRLALGVMLALACGSPPPAAPVVHVQSAPPPPVRIARAGPFPPTSRPWTVEDYAACVAALKTAPLPRLGGPSADVFSRMVSRDNLAAMDDPRLPFAKRFHALTELESQAAALLRAYIPHIAADPSLGREELALTGFVVHATARMWELTDDLVITLDPGDPTFTTRMGGVDRARHGTTQIVSGSLTMQTEPASAPFGAGFWADVAKDFAALVHRIAPEAQRDAVGRLAALERDAQDPALRAALAKVRRDIVSSPAPDFRVAKDGSAPPSPARPPADRTLTIEVDPAAPSQKVAAFVRALTGAGARKLELRMPGEARRLRLLRPTIESLPPSADDLDLTALLVRKGVSLKTRGGNVAPGCTGAGAGIAVANRRDGSPDADLLAACAEKLKLAAPRSRVLRIVAGSKAPFAHVMAVSEALGGKSLELFPDVRFGWQR